MKPPRTFSSVGAFVCALMLLCDPVQGENQDAHVHHEMEMSAAAMGTAPALPAESPLVRVSVDAEARVGEIIIGPMTLPAGGPHQRPQVQLTEVPFEGWMHGFWWEMRAGDGTVLPDRLLHHVNLIDPDNRELFSPVPRRVMAAGRETLREHLPELIGYPVEAGTRVLVSAMFASRPDESFDDAYLHIFLPFTPSDDPGWVGPLDIFPFYLDVMGPVGEKEFPLPPGTHGMSWEGTPAVDGRILAIGGHLHDYADWIRLEDVTTGDVLWTAEPEVDDAGSTIAVPSSMLWWRGGVPLRSDHVYRVSVQYTNPLARPAPDGGMGAIGGVMLARHGDWPAFDPEHPDYIADLRNTLEKPNEAGHGAHGHTPNH